jgi:hypothetical protein
MDHLCPVGQGVRCVFTYQTYKLRLNSLPGPLTYLNLLGSPMIIINDHQASKDLLDARQAIYSHRTAKDPKYRD